MSANIQIAMAALSASSEARPSSFGQSTAEQMLEIYRGSSLAGGQRSPSDGSEALVSSLASTIESLVKGLHSSGATERCKVILHTFTQKEGYGLCSLLDST